MYRCELGVYVHSEQWLHRELTVKVLSAATAHSYNWASRASSCGRHNDCGLFMHMFWSRVAPPVRGQISKFVSSPPNVCISLVIK